MVRYGIFCYNGVMRYGVLCCSDLLCCGVVWCGVVWFVVRCVMLCYVVVYVKCSVV